MKNKELHSEFTFQIEPKHYFKHNYLTYCNDVLVSMLKYADEEKMASVSIDLGNGENIEFEQDEKWQEWLITHGHREEMYEVYYRHTFFSLVADFCSYMLESINCAAKMKVAVSYALLRKPLKDTLGYIEWLRVDRNGIGKPIWFCLNKLTEETAPMMEEEVGKHGAIIGRMPLDHDLGLAGLTGTELQMTIAPVREMAQFLIH